MHTESFCCLSATWLATIISCQNADCNRIGKKDFDYCVIPTLSHALGLLGQSLDTHKALPLHRSLVVRLALDLLKTHLFGSLFLNEEPLGRVGQT